MNKRPNVPIPLLAAILGCFTGIAWQEYSAIKDPFVLLALLILSLPLALHAYASRKKLNLRIMTVFLCMLGTSCVYQLPRYALTQLTKKHSGKAVTLCGTIQDVREEGLQKIVTLENIELKTPASEKPAWFNKAIVYVPKKINTPLNGHLSLANTFIKMPTETLLPYHLKQHLLGFFFWKKESISITESPIAGGSWIENQKAHLNRSIIDVFSPTTQNMVKSIFLGDSQALTSETRSLFEQWGISHYLARSGLHLVLLAAVIIFILQACQLPIFVTRGATLALSILYHLLTSPSTSFLRAFMMNIMIGTSLFLGTTPTMLHLFSVVTLTTILNNPFTALNLDFQLSFGISGALIFMFNIVQKIETNSH